MVRKLQKFLEVISKIKIIKILRSDGKEYNSMSEIGKEFKHNNNHHIIRTHLLKNIPETIEGYTFSKVEIKYE